jgi:hypothetical protein
MSDIVTHPDPHIEAHVRHLLFNVVGTMNIGDPSKVYTFADLFTSIAERYGPAQAGRVYIRVTWH